MVAIAAGDGHSLALTRQGQVVAWQWLPTGESIMTTWHSNVVAIAAGGKHSLALTREGKVLGWGVGQPYVNGSEKYGQELVPIGLSNVVAIAAGYAHNLVLLLMGEWRLPPPKEANPSIKARKNQLSWTCGLSAWARS